MVRPAAQQPKYQAATQICRPHQQSPSFKLANVNQFVVSGNIQGGIGLTQDCVTLGQRQRELSQREPWMKPSSYRPPTFNTCTSLIDQRGILSSVMPTESCTTT